MMHIPFGHKKKEMLSIVLKRLELGCTVLIFNKIYLFCILLPLLPFPLPTMPSPRPSLTPLSV